METIEIFSKILDVATSKKYSDVHLCSWSYPIIRDNSWDILEISKIQSETWEIELERLDKKQVIEIINHILGPSKLKAFIDTFETDGSYHHSDGTRYRINCYNEANWFAIAFRIIPQEIPSLEELWLWKQIEDMCKKSKWLVIMTGPTWVGKSTNLAAMIDYINTKYRKHVITIEDPIEFVFKNKQSLINQREVWIHTKSFTSAIKSSLREDPDVIMIWEMRDLETIKAAITLAETWHLVFSTLHTNDTVQTIDRIIDIFPAGQQEQIRMQLAMSLLGVVSQRLLPRKWVDARIAAREILINNDAVRNLIITGKTHQLYSVIEIWWKQWMILLDHYLETLYNKWLISKETFISHVRDKENIAVLQSQ